METFKDTYADKHSAEDVEVYLTENYNITTIQKEIENPDCTYFFAFTDEIEPVGFMKVNTKKEPAELNGKTGLEIQRIYIKPNHKGKSIGKMLLNKAIQLTKDLNLACVWLCVWEHNLAAIQFYTKLGFVKIGTTTFNFGSTIDTDYYLMLES
ncbi:GNAT family N-acetyltransferase [Pedobacter sp. L105]|uniref:GNAT family N-acetyltransferase n=1 Tax=Pedobacter sp. L105 TaxID=1641871 RepID=UPI00131C27A1|nr:GNAT family N-acetyltransferase [Pedobacter sp. L105]